jgi:uncharacterized ferritin-like protein (DUF455 family)
MADEFTEDQFAILQHAVTMARNEEIRHLSTLRSRLERCGYSEADIIAALGFWVDYEHQKATPPSRVEMA